MSRRTEWALIGLVVVIYLALASQYAIHVPDWQAPDEPRPLQLHPPDRGRRADPGAGIGRLAAGIPGTTGRQRIRPGANGSSGHGRIRRSPAAAVLSDSSARLRSDRRRSAGDAAVVGPAGRRRDPGVVGRAACAAAELAGYGAGGCGFPGVSATTCFDPGQCQQ